MASQAEVGELAGFLQNFYLRSTQVYNACFILLKLATFAKHGGVR